MWVLLYHFYLLESLVRLRKVRHLGRVGPRSFVYLVELGIVILHVVLFFYLFDRAR